MPADTSAGQTRPDRSRLGLDTAERSNASNPQGKEPGGGDRPRAGTSGAARARRWPARARAPGRRPPGVRHAGGPLSDPTVERHQPDDRGPRAGGGSRAGGVHPRVPAPAPLRSNEEVLDLDLHDRLEPRQERAAEPLPQPARAVPDDLYRKRFLKDAVDQCVGQLHTHHRAVFVLRELEGKSYAEIAEITGCNLGTVKSRLNRARNSFAQLIEPLLE